MNVSYRVGTVTQSTNLRRFRSNSISEPLLSATTKVTVDTPETKPKTSFFKKCINWFKHLFTSCFPKKTNQVQTQEKCDNQNSNQENNENSAKNKTLFDECKYKYDKNGNGYICSKSIPSPNTKYITDRNEQKETEKEFLKINHMDYFPCGFNESRYLFYQVHPSAEFSVSSQLDLKMDISPKEDLFTTDDIQCFKNLSATSFCILEETGDKKDLEPQHTQPSESAYAYNLQELDEGLFIDCDASEETDRLERNSDLISPKSSYGLYVEDLEDMDV